jgi:hypothetical protein
MTSLLNPRRNPKKNTETEASSLPASPRWADLILPQIFYGHNEKNSGFLIYPPENSV